MSTTIIEAIDSVAKKIGEDRQILRDIGHKLGVTGFKPPAGAQSDPREEVIIRYTVGYGEFSADKERKYSALHMKMFDMDGNPDGTHDGVWQHMVPFADMFKDPDPPAGPLDKAEGPIEPVKVRANTKAIWTFGDGSSITAVGPASLSFVKFTDQSTLFLVAVNGIITNGTKRYKGARGVKTALGSTFIPKGADMQNPPGGKFGAVTVETFRVILAKDIMKGAGTEADAA